MCTNLNLQAKDGSVVVGRTMDLNLDLKSKVLVFPRNKQFTSRAPSGNNGHSWQARYGFVGMNALETESVSDGMNEVGLYCGALYLPGFTKYQEISEEDYALAIAPIDVVMFILSTSSNVAEAKEDIQKVKVWEEVTPQVGFAFPLHFVVHDKSGSCAVFEYVDGKLNIHDNPLGVLTNAPAFDWHLTNLRNYVNLSPVDAPSTTIAGLKITQLGEGSGMLGLPGDFTPPSRFVRAVALTQTVYELPNADVATNNVLHIINNFDLVLGVERNPKEEKSESDYTQWTTISDLANGKYYVRMHENPAYSCLELSNFDLGLDKVLSIDPVQRNWFRALS